ncbi:MAG: YdbL family protein [Pseudomonadota bacterium]
MTIRYSIIALISLGLAGLFVFGGADAASPAIERAKDQCIVGEQVDGYLGFADPSRADDALRREVRDTNQQRKSVYADLARREGVTIEVTAALAAEKLIAQSHAGECYRNSAGRWVRV